MRARKDGLVINVSSWAGRFETYLTGPAYNASKHAMAALTHSLNDEECVNGVRACVIYPGEVATPILRNRPKPPSPEEIARMLQPEDLGRTIRFVAEMPPRVCLNEILISPTWNRFYVGGADIARGRCIAAIAAAALRHVGDDGRLAPRQELALGRLHRGLEAADRSGERMRRARS